MSLKVLNSTIDKSVNFVEQQLTGFLESRYVRKTKDYFICYLSSQTGCNRGCKFCHLTVTGQTDFVDATVQDFHHQAARVWEQYRASGQDAKYMHYNFMARGEPLANKSFISDSEHVLNTLAFMAKQHDLPAKFNVSTIMPLTFKGSLVDVFRYFTPTIYYSLYSTSDYWRAEWLPGAMDWKEALRLLKDYQDFSKKIVKIHFPLINQENDNWINIHFMCEEIKKLNLMCEFNLIRYNPYSSVQGVESDQKTIDYHLATLREQLGGKVQVIPRVGFDVQASCGMFVE